MAVSEITNLVIEKGADYEGTFTLFNDDSSGLSLLGISSFSSRIRKHSTSIIFEDFAVTATLAPPATITLKLTAAQTRNLESGRNYFDVFGFTQTGNVPIKYIKGTIIVQDSMS